MQHIARISWAEVFASWTQNELKDPELVRVATEVKGWASLGDWRGFTAQLLGAAELDWNLYKLNDPDKEIPKMLIGPFHSLQEPFSIKNITSFGDLVVKPVEAPKLIHGYEKVVSMMKCFPSPTQMIGVVRPDTGDIVVVEGYHRSGAVALSLSLGRTTPLAGQIDIALAELSRAAILDEVLERGSFKKPLV